MHIWADLASVLDNLVNENAVLHVRLDLLRDRAFLGILVGSLLGRKHDVDCSALAGEDLGGQALLAQVDSGTIDLVQEEGGDDAVYLEGELGGLDDVKAADQGVDDDGEAGAVVDGDGVGLVVDLDDGLVAPRDEDGVVLLRVDLNDLAGVLEVLDEPFVAFQVLARGLPGAHALRLGFLARSRRLAPNGAACGGWTIGNHGAGAKVRVLVRHLRFVDLPEAGGDGFALVQLVEDS